MAFVASGVLMTGDAFARGGFGGRFGGGYRGADFGSGMGDRGMGNVRYSGNSMGDMSGYKGYQGDNVGSRQSFDNSDFSQDRSDFGGDQDNTRAPVEPRTIRPGPMSQETAPCSRITGRILTGRTTTPMRIMAEQDEQQQHEHKPE